MWLPGKVPQQVADTHGFTVELGAEKLLALQKKTLARKLSKNIMPRAAGKCWKFKVIDAG